MVNQKGILKALLCLACAVTLMTGMWKAGIVEDLISKVSTPLNTPPPFAKGWEEIYFKEIGSRIEGTPILPLRSKPMSPKTKEVRIWIGFGHQSLKAIILENNNGDWAAKFLPPVDKASELLDKSYITVMPKSGWATFWTKLDNLNIINADGDQDVIGDAKGLVVEIRTGDSYRNYMYNFPPDKSQEGLKAEEICNVLSSEFDLSFH